MAVILCDLAMMSYPHTVLRKEMAAHGRLASEAQVRERGRTRPPEATTAVCVRARARVQAKRGAQGEGAEADCRVPRRSHERLHVRPVQAPPLRVACGGGLTRSAP